MPKRTSIGRPEHKTSPSSTVDRISAVYTSLNEAERKVADLISNSPESVRGKSVTRVAEMSGVSPTTVIRFCGALGFDRYSSFKLALVEEIGAQRRAPRGRPSETIDSEARLMESIRMPSSKEIPVSSISQIKELPVGTFVSLSPKLKSTLVREAREEGQQPLVTGMYVEEADHSAGIRIVTTHVNIVHTGIGYFSAKGVIADLDGEKVIDAFEMKHHELPDRRSYVVNADGSGIVRAIGEFREVVAGDVRGLGRKGDIVWRDPILHWREGVDGPDHLIDGANAQDWVPRGVGNLIEGSPEERICFQSLLTTSLYVCTSGTQLLGTQPRMIHGTNRSIGHPVSLSDVDGDGIDELVFYNIMLQWYKVPSEGDHWDSTGYVADQTTAGIWTRLVGVATFGDGRKAAVGKQTVIRGGLIELYFFDTQELVPLQGTESVWVSYAATNDPLVADCDGDGSEDNIVFQNAYSGHMAYYKMRTDGAWRPENLHVISERPGAPQAVVIPENGPAQVVFFDRPVIAPQPCSVARLHEPGLPMTGLMVRFSGQIVEADQAAGWLKVSDGSPDPVKVNCIGFGQSSGYVVVTGCVGAETDKSGRIVPVIRAYVADDLQFIL